ncbi:MAG TPA: RluA family pseudouridine synthase [Candidatus Merdivicinus intestinigallinarum]|nr:RluA family pseudouridine synthase [Candidatus Merdivicinus intestinigallinarum]
MGETLLFCPEPEDAGSRLDAFLALNLEGKTRSAVQKLMDQGKVLVNGKTGRKNDKVKPGDSIQVEIPEPEPLELLPQDIPLDIVYEDEHLLVVNKPKGMVVHPAPGNPDGTLVNALLYHCGESLSGINGVIRPGIVHRIDKDTSGLLMVAKNDLAHQSLAAQIAAHTFTRMYNTVVYGNLKTDEGTISAPIARHPTDRKKMAVVPGGREAVTHYRVLERLPGFTLVECRLETGRTHQIRVHMAHIGHPVAGDPVYGPKKCITSLNGQCLHARLLGFVHPATGEYMEFDSGLPPYFTDFLEKLRRKGGALE